MRGNGSVLGEHIMAREGSTERVCGAERGGGRKAGVVRPNLPAGGKDGRRWGGLQAEYHCWTGLDLGGWRGEGNTKGGLQSRW